MVNLLSRDRASERNWIASPWLDNFPSLSFILIMATFDQFITSLEQEFGEQGKGKPFEAFCKWFLENDPEWSKTVDKVWLWDEDTFNEYFDPKGYQEIVDDPDDS